MNPTSILALHPSARSNALRPVNGYIVQTIGSVRTTTGLVVKAALDTREYEKGIRVTDAEMEGILLTKAPFHGEWNYAIHSRRAQRAQSAGLAETIPRRSGWDPHPQRAALERCPTN